MMPPKVWKGSQALGIVISSSGGKKQIKSFVPSCIIDKLPLLVLNNTTKQEWKHANALSILSNSAHVLILFLNVLDICLTKL